jgi:POT family proton-dependent oligopeptide transporter
MGYRNMESREYAAESTEVPATWFGILNFIYCWFCLVFSKWWESNIIFSANEIWTRTYLLGLGFGFLAYGSGINADSVVRVSMFWLIAAYLFHTLGELCISVGLSYVSKLVPAA